LAINRDLNVPRRLQSKDSKKLTPPAAAKFVSFFLQAARQRDGGMPHPKEMAEGPGLFAYQVSGHPHAACGWLRA
jgi:hypothetical protein